MAKALLGYVGSSVDAVSMAEIRRLRRRVADLEAEVSRLRRFEEIVLATEVDDAALMHLVSEQPALA